MRDAGQPAVDRVPIDDAWRDQAPRVRRYLRFLGAERDVVDDLVQEALLAALRSFGPGGAPLPWLLTTARNLRAQHLRRLGRRREIADLDRLEAAWHEQARPDGGDAQRDALAACLEQLPERTRAALVHRYRDGASRHTIATAIGIGEEGVKSLLARARALLADCMQRRLDHD
jgi:RNA polymerase sigma-70 factor, ECF subfamily